MFRRLVLAGLVAVTALGAACNSGGTGSGAPSPSPSRTAQAGNHEIDPANFSSTVDNPWFPLTPGTTLVYEGTKEGERLRDVVTVTADTKVVQGVECVVVSDNLYLEGRLAERTLDYHAQDSEGNVWYFGEDTEELNAKGEVTTTKGTWHAGVDGAEAGIFMEASPEVGHSFQQEYYKGEAEDMYEVLSLSESVTVPYGSYEGVQRTKEWTPLEPNIVGEKYYARGVGLIKEATVKGPEDEEAFLVDVRTE